MHSATIIIALAGIAAASAQAIGVAADIHAYPAYQTSYSVADKLTGDQKSAHEVRDGGVTKGSYSLVQPDGVLRTVNYISTPTGGFQAQVINTGAAAHPSIVGVAKGIGAVAAPGLALGGVGGGLALGGIRGIGAIGAPGLGLGGLGLGAASIVGGYGLPIAAGLGVAPLGLGARVIG